MSLILLYLILICLVSCQRCLNVDNNDDNKSIYINFSNSIKAFIKETFSENDCFDNLPMETFLKVASFSGKDFNELGFEKECNKKLQYFIFYYRIDKLLFQKIFPKKVSALKLLGNATNYFYTGICLPKSCRQNLENENDLEKLKNNLQGILGIKDLNYIYKVKEEDKESDEKRKYFLVISIPVVIYFMIKCVVSIINLFVSSENLSQARKRSATEVSLKTIGQKGESIKEMTLGAEDDKLFTSSYADMSRSEITEIQTKRPLKSLSEFFDLSSNYSLLNEKKNSLYNEKNLNIISLIRLVIIFLIVYGHVHYSTMKFPGEDFFNLSIYNKFLFVTIKISAYSVDCFIALESFTMVFKLMNYYKIYHLQRGNGLAKVLLKFYSLVIPKVILFFANFYYLHYFSKNISTIFRDDVWVGYYLKTVAGEKECEKGSWKILIPFYFAYIDRRDDKSSKYGNCFRFAYVYLNAFYCFTLFLVFFYLMNKLKSKIFDTLIFLGVLVGVCLTNLSFLSGVNRSGIYDYSFVLGQNLTLKLTHLFYNTYMIGIFFGMIYFYYLDVVSNHPITENPYIPFSFCFTLTKMFDKMKTILKVFCSFIIGAILLLFGMSYNIFKHIYNDDKSGPPKETFEITNFLSYFDIYDKPIFVILLLTLTIIIIMLKSTLIKSLSSFNILNFFSRISLSIFCSMDTLIYLSYVWFQFQIKINYMNLILLSVAEFCWIGLICGVITVIFELPFRMGIKFLMHRKEEYLHLSPGLLIK